MIGLASALRRSLGCRPQFLQPLVNGCRMKSEKCGPSKAEKCPGKFKKFPCGKPKKMLIQKPKINEKKATRPPSMWLNPFCDEGEVHCPFNPRFDDIYYIESDKAKRKYWQTWASCPPLQIKKKKVCCHAKFTAAPLRRRKHKKPKTACPHMPVRCEEDTKCKRVKRPCHRRGRIPPNCLKVRRKLICTKPLTPYPAFSECSRMKPNALPLSECICWNKPMICEVWAEWRRRSMMKKRQ